MLNYSINIVWSDEDEGYIATIPELKNLSAFGETYEEALKEIKIAAEGYIEALESEKMPPPENYKVSSYSGQTRLRMPQHLHQLLAQEAQQQGVSLNTYMVYLLSFNYGVSKNFALSDKFERYIYVLKGSTSSSIEWNRNRIYDLHAFAPIKQETIGRL